MDKKTINQDIRVSLFFTLMSFVIIVGFSIHGIFSTAQQYFTNILYYALPISILSIFFSRTAQRKGIDEFNQTMITKSFHLALIASGISLLILLIVAIVT